MASKVVLLKYIFKKRIKFTFYFACAGWWRGWVVHQRHKLACSSFEMCAEWTRVNSRKATHNNPLICSAINLKIHEKEKKKKHFFSTAADPKVSTPGGTNGEREYECWVWIPWAADIYIWLERGEKVQPKQNTTLKLKQISQRCAWLWEYNVSAWGSL